MSLEKFLGLKLEELLRPDDVVEVLNDVDPLLQPFVVFNCNLDILVLSIELNTCNFTVHEKIEACELFTAEVILVFQLVVEQGQDSLIEFTHFPVELLLGR